MPRLPHASSQPQGSRILRDGPVCSSHPKAFSTSQRFPRLMPYPTCRVVLSSMALHRFFHVLDDVRGHVQFAEHTHQPRDITGFVRTHRDSAGASGVILQHCSAALRANGFTLAPACSKRHCRSIRHADDLEYYGYDIPWSGSIILRSLSTSQRSPTSPQVI